MVFAMKRVIFLCTGNSARSQLAEALLRHQAGHYFEVFSAGSEPHEVDPRTIAALQKFHLPVEGLHSKSIDEFAGQSFDYVITLCDKARQECAQLPQAREVIAWDYPDPRTSDNPRAFELTLQELNERIKMFVLVQSKEQKSALTPVINPLQLFKCLADETRLAVMLLLQHRGTLSVTALAQTLQESQPKVSRHLAQLRGCGLVLDERCNQNVLYQIHPRLPDWSVRIITEAAQADSQRIQDLAQRINLRSNA